MKHPSIDDTILLAARLYAGQRDKAGVPYLAHPLAVLRKVNTFERAWHVAVLHDVVEDCGVTLDALCAAGYSDEEVAAIDLLTRRRVAHGFCWGCGHEHSAGETTPCLVINCECETPRDETYEEFIERIATSESPIAIAVKLADLADNLDPSRRNIMDAADRARSKRYREAVTRLLEVSAKVAAMLAAGPKEATEKEVPDAE